MIHRRWSAVALLLLTVSCTDTEYTAPKPASLLFDELTFFRFNADAYQAADKSASFWAVPGETRSVSLRYSDSGREFMRFTVGGNSLAGSDSVRIEVRLDEQGMFAFHFSPSGLRFNSNAPAVLRVDRGRTNPDVDGNGRVDLGDALLTLQADIWKQELPGLPWLRIPSLNLLGDVEQTNVYDFTSFGMAVD